MDYNYFATATQPFQYMDYGADIGVLSNDGFRVSSEQPLSAGDVNAFALGSYEFNPFDATSDTNLSAHLRHADSVSPPAHHMSSFTGGSVDSGIALDLEHERSRRNSSEEKENLTPAQSRRKAQNRAAQRAFRERKEKHVKELEAKLTLLTTTTSLLQSDNGRLKFMLQRAQTEIEILKATAASSFAHGDPPGFVDDPSFLPSSRQSRSPPSAELLLRAKKLANGLLSTELSSPQSSVSPGSEGHLLSASATWDLLQSHPLYLSGAVDIGEVCVRLETLARCEGMGPVFEEEEVRKVIEEVGGRTKEEEPI